MVNSGLLLTQALRLNPVQPVWQVRIRTKGEAQGVARIHGITETLSERVKNIPVIDTKGLIRDAHTVESLQCTRKGRVLSAHQADSGKVGLEPLRCS